ncbi:dnaJsubfamily B member 4-like [Dorcoceras hygrometricum]|uniref:DnaJsubfamily B member 4-like n=1 Tax=Dorcoceras hygrometricum TaxID=472368 RepID=A0A2Z7CFW8_9LAMI|nr:dnaJsubfamily B member 4-like [Dorcoceras hygrometricum]
MMRRRAGDSADELVLMTSSVTSSYSADGLRDQSQESAGSLHPDAREEATSRSYSGSSRKMKYQTQATAASSRRAYMNQLLLINQSQALHIQSTWFPGAKKRRSSKAQQLKNESAAKQLTTYEELSKLDVNC